ncbi:hypothetical protein BKA70DRAFT_1557756 [Coprinopsis sp. MPI-PUGE-AT-0042]|nr:hypothetical protein BKA70DRAFT_1557756 [Coprinopsis sp. MPI-PUGE-AT-0042]
MPLQSYPVELLSIIFSSAASIYGLNEDYIDLPKQLQSIESLRLVCRQWNSAIEGDPIFWSSCSVSIRDDPSTEGPFQMMETLQALEFYFSRSGSFPLRLAIYLYFLKRGTQLIRFQPIVHFVSSFDRWKALYFEHEESAAGNSTRDPWWLSFFVFSDQLKTKDCFRNVRQLTLECGGDDECYLHAKDLTLDELFPNVARLDVGLRDIQGVDILARTIGPLKNLRWLRFVAHDFEEGPEHSTPLIHSILNQLPRLQHFEPVIYSADLYEIDNPPSSYPTTNFVHKSLTSLKVEDPNHLVPLFSLLVFPALEALCVAEVGFYPDTQGGRDTFECLHRMLAQSSKLHTLNLGCVDLSDDDLVTLLCNHPSLRYVHVMPYECEGRFLSGLNAQLLLGTHPVLPRLVSFVVDLDWYKGKDEFDTSAFKDFVEDPKRFCQEGLEVGACVFERLRHAVLTVDGRQVYSRIDGHGQT